MGQMLQQVNLVEAKGNLEAAFINLIKGADQETFDQLVFSLDELRFADVRIYQSLLGNTLLNGIINAIEDEYDLRIRTSDTFDFTVHQNV